MEADRCFSMKRTDSSDAMERDSFVLPASLLIPSISRMFTGKAMKISSHPMAAKWLAIFTEETVILSIPSFLNHLPIAEDW